MSRQEIQTKSGLKALAVSRRAWFRCPIGYTESDRTITLTGQDMTIEEVILIARHGARVELSDEARQRAKDAWGLLMQGAAEGVPIYWFNRGAGSAREIWMFKGSPMEPQNKKRLEEQQLARFSHDIAAAEALLQVGIHPVKSPGPKAQLAAWCSVSRALFNLHETITRY